MDFTTSTSLNISQFLSPRERHRSKTSLTHSLRRNPITKFGRPHPNSSHIKIPYHFTTGSTTPPRLHLLNIGCSHACTPNLLLHHTAFAYSRIHASHNHSKPFTCSALIPSHWVGWTHCNEQRKWRRRHDMVG